MPKPTLDAIGRTAAPHELTWNHEVGEGAGLLLVFIQAQHDFLLAGDDFQSTIAFRVTYAGQDLEFLTGESSGASVNQSLFSHLVIQGDTWILRDPPPGVGEIEVTLSGPEHGEFFSDYRPEDVRDGASVSFIGAGMGVETLPVVLIYSSDNETGEAPDSPIRYDNEFVTVYPRPDHFLLSSIFASMGREPGEDDGPFDTTWDIDGSTETVVDLSDSAPAGRILTMEYEDLNYFTDGHASGMNAEVTIPAGQVRTWMQISLEIFITAVEPPPPISGRVARYVQVIG